MVERVFNGSPQLQYDSGFTIPIALITPKPRRYRGRGDPHLVYYALLPCGKKEESLLLGGICELVGSRAGFHVISITNSSFS